MTILILLTLLLILEIYQALKTGDRLLKEEDIT